jgi:hypothetical protein
MGVVKLRVVETLEQAAASINRQFEIADRENEKSKGVRAKERYARLTAGLELLDARERVTSGRETNMGWEEWCEQNIDRSQSDIRAVMGLATKVRTKAATPQEAVEEERARARASMRGTRARRSAETVSAVDQAMAQVRALTADELQEFDEAYQSFKKEDDHGL